MSAIRVLTLGVLSGEPMHGYQVRQALETWHAEQWANIAYGSIYSALGKMAEEGLVEVVGEAPGTAPRSSGTARRAGRITYAITEAGRGEFLRLLREYWWGEKPIIDPFQVAITFMDRLPLEEVLAALRQRAARSRAFLDGWAAAWPVVRPRDLPRFMEENHRLDIAHVETETHWIESVIAKIERGELP